MDEEGGGAGAEWEAAEAALGGRRGMGRCGPVEDGDGGSEAELHSALGHTPLPYSSAKLANKLVERSIELARAIATAGGHVLVENPPDRGNDATNDSVLSDTCTNQNGNRTHRCGC